MESLRENIKVSLDESLKKRDDIATSTMRLILAAIKEDCAGDPPGELIIKTTAESFLNENAFSIVLETDTSFKPAPNVIDGAIVPSSLTMATLFFFLKSLETQFNLTESFP